MLFYNINFSHKGVMRKKSTGIKRGFHIQDDDSMTNGDGKEMFVRKTIRIHKTLNDRVEKNQQEELFSSWTDSIIDLVKKGLEKKKEETKRW